MKAQPGPKHLGGLKPVHPIPGGIIGLGAALEYVSALGLNNIAEYEQNLMHYALSQLESVPDLTLYGPQNRLGVIAFNLGKHHAYDVGSFSR